MNIENDKIESVNSLDELEQSHVEEGGGIFCLSGQPGETNGQYPRLRRGEAKMVKVPSEKKFNEVCNKCPRQESVN